MPSASGTLSVNWRSKYLNDAATVHSHIIVFRWMELSDGHHYPDTIIHGVWVGGCECEWVSQSMRQRETSALSGQLNIRACPHNSVVFYCSGVMGCSHILLYRFQQIILVLLPIHGEYLLLEAIECTGSFQYCLSIHMWNGSQMSLFLSLLVFLINEIWSVETDQQQQKNAH